MIKSKADAGTVITNHYENETNAALQLLKMAGESIKQWDHQHAINLLESAIDHLKAAEIIHRVLRDIGSTQ